MNPGLRAELDQVCALVEERAKRDGVALDLDTLKFISGYMLGVATVTYQRGEVCATAFDFVAYFAALASSLAGDDSTVDAIWGAV